MLHPSLTWRGGAERQILKLAVDLQKMGHVVEIFTCSVSDTCFPELRRQVTVNEVRTPTFSRRSMVSPERSAGLKAVQRRSSFRNLAHNFKNYYYNLPAMANKAEKFPKVST